MNPDTLQGYCAALRDQVLPLYEALNALVVELENRKAPTQETDDAPTANGPCPHPSRRRRVVSKANQPVQFLCEACQTIVEEQQP